jgi:hypothetical protein
MTGKCLFAHHNPIMCADYGAKKVINQHQRSYKNNKNLKNR